MFISLFLKPIIAPVCLSKLNRRFFFFSNSSGSIPAIALIRLSPAPSLLMLCSRPLNSLMLLSPPNSLSIAADDASKPFVTPIWLLRTSLSFFKMSSRDEAAGPDPPPEVSSSVSD